MDVPPHGMGGDGKKILPPWVGGYEDFLASPPMELKAGGGIFHPPPMERRVGGE